MARKTTSTTKSAPRRKATRVPAPRQPRESSAARSQKSAFGIGTWITLLVFAILIGLAVFLNNKKESAVADATPTKGTTNLFPASEGTPSVIEVKTGESGEAVRIVRNKENAWVMELPLETEADPGMSEAAAAQVSALKIVNEIDGDPEIFGLDNPVTIITVEFASGKKHTLEIGDSTPTNSGYYARIDGDKMVITDLNGIEALLQLQVTPPYLHTPTPTATATQTPTPTQVPTETPIPEATATPTP